MRACHDSSKHENVIYMYIMLVEIGHEYGGQSWGNFGTHGNVVTLVVAIPIKSKSIILQYKSYKL